VSLDGFEKTNFTGYRPIESNKGTEIVPCKQKYRICEIKKELVNCTEGLHAEGQYEYKFRLHLPRWLPTSFMLQSDTFAMERKQISISYKLCAVFKVCEPGADNELMLPIFRHKQEVFIHRPSGMTDLHFLDETSKEWHNPHILYISKKAKQQTEPVPVEMPPEIEVKEVKTKIDARNSLNKTLSKRLVENLNDAWMRQPLVNQRYAKSFKPQMTVIRCCADRLFYYPGQEAKIQACVDNAFEGKAEL